MYWSKRYQQQWVKPNKNMWTSQQLAMWLLHEMSSWPHVVKMCTVRWRGLFKYQLSLDQTLPSLENCMLRKKHQNAAQFKGSAKGKLSSPANVARRIFRCFLKFYTKDNHPEFNPFAKILSSPKMTVEWLYFFQQGLIFSRDRTWRCSWEMSPNCCCNNTIHSLKEKHSLKDFRAKRKCRGQSQQEERQSRDLNSTQQYWWWMEKE